MRTILGLIPARGGSKGVPGKNIRPLGGAPLVAHTIRGAVRSGCFDRVLVSTDDQAIADIARQWGAEAPWLRPREMAADDSPVIEAVLHALDRLERDDEYVPEAVALLQPTSPFRSIQTIRRGVELCRTSGHSVVSVSASRVHPYWCKRMDSAGFLAPFVDGVDVPQSRQELPPAYALNGVLYVARTSTLRRCRSFHGDRALALVVGDQEGLDIDTPMDWDLAEWLWTRRTEPAGQ